MHMIIIGDYCHDNVQYAHIFYTFNMKLTILLVYDYKLPYSESISLRTYSQSN